MESVAEVSRYVEEKSGGNMVCTYEPGKGRVSVAARDLAAGEILLREPGLAEAEEPKEGSNLLYTALTEWSKIDDWHLHPLWTWCVFCMLLTEEEVAWLARYSEHSSVLKQLLDLPIPHYAQAVRDRLCMLYTPDESDADETDEIYVDLRSARKHTAELLQWTPGVERAPDYVVNLIPHFSDPHDPSRIRGDVSCEQLLCAIFDLRRWQKFAHVWVLNCFEGNSDPLTYLVYFAPAFSSHSCLPNSLWHLDDSESPCFVLVARRNIRAGEEITFTYTSDSHLLEPTFARREDLLTTKYFTCQCERCVCEADISRGFRCRHCRKGQWFLPTEEPPRLEPRETYRLEVMSDFKIVDAEHLSPASERLEEHQIRSFIKRIEDDNLSAITIGATCPRVTGELMKYVAGIKPYKCLHCHKVADENARDLALDLEGYMLALGEKDEGTERELGHRFSTVLLPTHIMPMVGHSHLLMSMLERRQAELGEKGEWALASEYAYARFLLALQMCPILTGFIAWTAIEYWEMRVRYERGAYSARPWELLHLACHCVKTIFSVQSSYFLDVTNNLVDVLEAVAELEAEEQEQLRQLAAAIPELAPQLLRFYNNQ